MNCTSERRGGLILLATCSRNPGEAIGLWAALSQTVNEYVQEGDGHLVAGIRTNDVLPGSFHLITATHAADLPTTKAIIDTLKELRRVDAGSEPLLPPGAVLDRVRRNMTSPGLVIPELRPRTIFDPINPQCVKWCDRESFQPPEGI